MSDALTVDRGAILLTDAIAGIDALLAHDTSTCTADDLLERVRLTERLRRKLAAVDHGQDLELDRRGVAIDLGARTVPNLLRNLLCIDSYEASARLRAAKAAGSRRSLIGEQLPPAYPLVAAAQAAGRMSAKQARITTELIEKLPDCAVEEGPGIEARFVEFAKRYDPTQLALLAQRERDHLDPDGKFTDLEQRRRQRGFAIKQRADGSGTASGELTAELTEFLRVAFDSLAAPKPESNGVKDPRTATQRQHDALLDIVKMAVRSKQLPDAGGVTATVVLTMSAEDYANGTGFATTSHGAAVPVREAIQWGGGDTRVMAVVFNSLKAVIAYSSAHRLFTERERLVMAARDGGCSFPSCTAPPGWTQSHHIREYRDGGPTSVENGCLLCSYHHREFERLGWRVVMTDGLPHWIPPKWVDPVQKPIPPQR